MIEKQTVTDRDIHPLLRARRSPRTFSPEPIPAEQVQALLEAARWSPSAGNEQPWNFLVIPREDSEAFAQALSVLNEGNQVWAQQAPLLIFAVARLTRANDDRPNTAALYDLGQAVAHLSVQASALGLWLRQMGGFSTDRAREVFGIPENHAPVVAIALGELGDLESLPENLREREQAPRTRKPLESFVFGGHWGEVSPLIEE